MGQRFRPCYTHKHSTQTLQQGLEEYYQVNSHITDVRELPKEFAHILMAHDVSHVVLGCETTMYDELKLLPLTFWTSDFKFRDYIRTNQDPKIKPAIDIMYNDLIKQYGLLGLYSSILLVLPPLLPELLTIWFKNRVRRKYYPFLDYESFLNRSLLEIRQEYDLLPLIKI
ncbi:hypothetical protein [Gloeothece verrucosa]|uniref:Uncharacterized protein n=1 Tax=Gloeothece verrucosa (strain PCC 7822) TaxID=497965 RepID=E0UEQ8_GLOV7|nr:hypothetical protein [Gloeothece verrucosa]ADN16626.1 conserved hypothetical protein [Gloeothece verrucosa PCC 7822]